MPVVVPTLPEIINASSVGHFAHHQALHKFYNLYAATLEDRLSAVEAVTHSLTKSDYTVGPFTYLGDITQSVLSLVKAPITQAGKIDHVECRLFAGPPPGGSFDIEFTRVDGGSIFTPGTFPRPHFTAGQTLADAIPDPARAVVAEHDSLSMHIVGFVAGTGAAANTLVGSVVIVPT